VRPFPAESSFICNFKTAATTSGQKRHGERRSKVARFKVSERQANSRAGNIAIGRQAGVNVTTGNNNIDIGNVGVAGDAAKIRIGKQGTQTATYVAGIYGKTVASGIKVGVMIDSTGKLGTSVSSARLKEAIRPMDKASETILALKPVTFRYKHDP